MKAGIFQTAAGNLLYVAKDRTVKATTLHPSIVGDQVSTFDRGDAVHFDLDQDVVQARRVAGVPNGCTDHAKALADYRASDAYQPPEGVLDAYVKDESVKVLGVATVPPFTVKPGDVGYDEMAKIFGLREGEVAGLLSEPRVTSMPPTFGAPYGAEAQQAVLEKYRKVMIAGGWRPVHRQSARKHRRKGHVVREAFGRTWWRPQA